MTNKYTGRSIKDFDGTWTLLWDMHSGGGAKTEWGFIFIQAEEEDAIRYANHRWDIHPDNVTCTCCGNDFSVSSGTFVKVASYHFKSHEEQGSYRRPGAEVPDEVIINRALYGKIKDFGASESHLLVFADEMGDEWKDHDIHRSGYVWVD